MSSALGGRTTLPQLVPLPFRLPGRRGQIASVGGVAA